MEQKKRKIKCEIYRDSFQNSKRYGIPKAQLIIADVPYNVGTNFYGSNPSWYVGGIIKMEKVNLQGNRLLIAILTLTFTNTSTFARGCLLRTIQSLWQGAEVVTVLV